MHPKHARIAFAALAAFACCAALVAGAPARADHHTGADKAKTATAATPATDAGHDAMMAKMMKNAAPGPEHKSLAAMVGSWKATIKMWSGPGEPQVSEGTSVNTMKFGDRCLEGRFKGTFLGAPMEGLSLMGFDNGKKEYWSFWTDDMSTSSMAQTGTGSADGKSIVLKCMVDGPDGKPVEGVSTTTVMDTDRHVYTMATRMGDQLVPMMEITYTRAK